MSQTDSDILLISLGVIGLLMAATFLGEVLRARLPEGETNPVVETFVTRVHSWWTMVILLSLALLIGTTGIVLIFAVASFAALREFLTFSTKRRADHLSLVLAFFAVLPLQYLFVGLDAEGLFGTFIPVYAFLLLPVVSALRGDPRGFLVRVAETQWGLMTAVYCISHVPALTGLEIPGYGNRQALLIVFFVVVVQCGDLVEYWVGRRIGRHRIAPGLSPKSWEGVAVGAGVAALAGGVLAWTTPFGVAGAMVMGLLASLAGFAGSLVFAAIKRDRGVRDWSHLIPGQGGFLEQLDSVIFAAPVFYHLTGVFWAV